MARLCHSYHSTPSFGFDTGTWAYAMSADRPLQTGSLFGIDPYFRRGADRYAIGDSSTDHYG